MSYKVIKEGLIVDTEKWRVIMCLESLNRTLVTLTQPQISHRLAHSLLSWLLGRPSASGLLKKIITAQRASCRFLSSAPALLKSFPGHPSIDQGPGAEPNEVPAQKWTVLSQMGPSWWGCVGWKLLLFNSLCTHRPGCCCSYVSCRRRVCWMMLDLVLLWYSVTSEKNKGFQIQNLTAQKDNWRIEYYYKQSFCCMTHFKNP